MFVDIHTHSSSNTDNHSVRNLTFVQADAIIASAQEGLFSVGFHPWYADAYSEEGMTKLETWITDSRFVAIGECGLDKNSKVPFEIQLQIFEKQITLSEKTEKPLIIHCVGGFNELFELKRRLKPRQPWIIHGFRGKPELATQALKAGCALSFGEHFHPESVRLTPIDRLFVETDESHVPIQDIYLSISKIKNCTVEALNAGENLLKLVK